jgi:hypothetical protein
MITEHQHFGVNVYSKKYFLFKLNTAYAALNYICKLGYSETESGRTANPSGAAESGTGEETSPIRRRPRYAGGP